MPLTLHRSHRLEWLADALAADLRAHPQPPLLPECVVVQSLGVRRWLACQLAERLGVAMHIEFPFPAQFVEETLGRLCPGETPGPFFRREVLPWRIHAVLPALLPQPEFSALRHYVDDDPLKLWQLSTQLAAVFDRYLAYRPEVLLRWDEDEAREGEDWQAELWRAVAHGQPHAASLLRDCAQPAGKKEAEPLPRCSIFGISTLPPFYLQILAALAGRADVHFYLLTPTREYWGDIRSEREQARLRRWMAKRGANPEAHRFSEEHPLLASLGRIGREFHEALLDLTPTAERDYFDAPPGVRETPPAGETLLSTVQHSLLALRLPEEKLPIAPGTASLQIHNCHSPLREVEVLHDQLLALFDADPTLEPRDVMVAVSDIDLYGPCIEAVFGAPESDAVRFPHSIADRAAHTENAVADALLRFLEIADSRYTASAVLALLDCAPIRARFEMTEADLPLVRDWAARSGIRWGLDEEHRARLGLPSIREHTWRFGLDRLLMGFALPPDANALFHGILPDGDVEGDLAVTLGRFADFCTTLFALGERLASLEITAAEWTAELRAALALLCASDDIFAEKFRAASTQVSAVEEYAQLAGHGSTIPFPVLRAHLKTAFADTERSANFLRGGITFCAFKPMRAIPHRVIALLGLNDDAFPRSARPPAFDLTAMSPRAGDRTLRDDDRYFFLETLLSARDALLLSYCGQSPKDNSPRPPSVIVTELLDHLSRHYSPAFPHQSVAAQLTTRHRLQAFSPHYFESSALSRMFSYSRENARAAAQRFAGREGEPPFACALKPEAVEGEVPLATLIRALTESARYFVHHRLRLTLPFEQAAIEDAEPITLDGLSRFRLAGRITGAILDGEDPASLLAPARADGLLPHGYTGDSAFADADATARRLAAAIARHAPGPPLPPQEVTLALGKWTLTARFAPLTGTALVSYRPGRLRARDRLAAWLAHLALCAAAPANLPLRTVSIGADLALSFTAIEPKIARQHLTTLLSLYERAHAEALPLFPEASFGFAEYRLNLSGHLRREAHAVARDRWDGSRYNPFEAECDDAWNALVWRGDRDPLDEEFERLAMEVFAPLLHAQQMGAPVPPELKKGEPA